MKAYTTTVTKKEFVAELIKHQKADDFIRGTYWNVDKGKGCAVGCSLQSISKLKDLKFSFDDHSLYETHLGIPEWLARLEDTIFENISLERSKTWPVEFAKAIKVGANLEKAKSAVFEYYANRLLEILSDIKGGE